MGMFDTVLVKCPKCGEEHQFQSKSGNCSLDVYTLEDCPEDVMFNINRHSPYECNCNNYLSVDVQTKKVLVKTKTE